MSSEKAIVTGAAGFIGYHTCKRLLKENFNIIGIDNINDYYNKKLKLDRLKNLNETENNNLWEFIKGDIENEHLIKEIFESFKPDIVINLAAQAGVRYSIKNPKSYIKSNLIGFANILEACRNTKVNHLIYGSSSSVYGGNFKTPFKETDSTNYPISLYAATKSANELMAQSYSHLYDISCTGLRFFTVYGPWGRPDMAPMIFADSIINKKPLKIFNHGDMKRDFTYIDDVIEAIYRCCKKSPKTLLNKKNKDQIHMGQNAPHMIFNVGNNNPINLIDFIESIENALNMSAIREYKSIEPGDVKETFADTKALKKWLNFTPKTSLKIGIKEFIDWYKSYYL